MAKLQIDNPFFIIMGKLGDLALLNLLWLACCLPVVTIGASTAALFSVARKMAADEDYRTFADFFHAFRDGWKTATAVWLILLLAGAVSLADLLIGIRTSGRAGGIFLAIGAALCHHLAGSGRDVHAAAGALPLYRKAGHCRRAAAQRGESRNCAGNLCTRVVDAPAALEKSGGILLYPAAMAVSGRRIERTVPDGADAARL